MVEVFQQVGVRHERIFQDLLETLKFNILIMFNDMTAEDQYHNLLDYIQRRNASGPQPDDEEEIILFRGPRKEEGDCIRQQSSAGGKKPDVAVPYPGDIAKMAQQQGSDGESCPTTPWRGPQDRVEYTFNQEWATSFSCERSRLRGALLVIAIQKKYVNVPHPERRDGRELGVFCASAAPVRILN